MNNTVLSDGTVLYYALKVNGRIVTAPVANQYALEKFRETLPDNQKAIAETVQVTADGRELLLG